MTKPFVQQNVNPNSTLNPIPMYKNRYTYDTSVRPGLGGLLDVPKAVAGGLGNALFGDKEGFQYTATPEYQDYIFRNGVQMNTRQNMASLPASTGVPIGAVKDSLGAIGVGPQVGTIQEPSVVAKPQATPEVPKKTVPSKPPESERTPLPSIGEASGPATPDVPTQQKPGYLEFAPDMSYVRDTQNLYDTAVSKNNANSAMLNEMMAARMRTMPNGRSNPLAAIAAANQIGDIAGGIKSNNEAGARTALETMNPMRQARAEANKTPDLVDKSKIENRGELIKALENPMFETDKALKEAQTGHFKNMDRASKEALAIKLGLGAQKQNNGVSAGMTYDQKAKHYMAAMNLVDPVAKQQALEWLEKVPIRPEVAPNVYGGALNYGYGVDFTNPTAG